MAQTLDTSTTAAVWLLFESGIVDQRLYEAFGGPTMICADESSSAGVGTSTSGSASSVSGSSAGVGSSTSERSAPVSGSVSGSSAGVGASTSGSASGSSAGASKARKNYSLEQIESTIAMALPRNISLKEGNSLTFDFRKLYNFRIGEGEDSMELKTSGDIRAYIDLLRTRVRRIRGFDVHPNKDGYEVMFNKVIILYCTYSKLLKLTLYQLLYNYI